MLLSTNHCPKKTMHRVLKKCFIADNPWCPMNIFNLYVDKLHKDLKSFWQRPRKSSIHYTDHLWYDKIRVGHGPIENCVANLSAEAQLSKRYTNRSIRSTVIGILKSSMRDDMSLGSVAITQKALSSNMPNASLPRKNSKCVVHSLTIFKANISKPRDDATKPQASSKPSATISKSPVPNVINQNPEQEEPKEVLQLQNMEIQ